MTMKHASNEARAQYWLDRRKWQWRNDPEYKAKQTARVMARYQRVKNTQKHKDNQARYDKTFAESLRKDPAKMRAWKEACTKRSKAKWQKIKSDPALHEAWKNKSRENQRRRRAKQ